MQNIIGQWLDELKDIIPSYFKDDQKIKDNLLNFVTFENVEWFNIALVYYQKPNAVFIQSKQQWNNLLVDKEFYIKKGEKGIKVLIPYIDDEKLVFKWKIGTVWDISQCQSNINYEYVSNLKIYTEEIQRDIFENFNNYDEIIKFLLNESYCYIPSNMRTEVILNYIENCLKYILLYYLNINFDIDEPNLILNNIHENEYIVLYSVLDEIMKNLYILLKKYFDELYAKEKERKEIEEAYRIFNMNIKDRIFFARKKLQKEYIVGSHQIDDEK